MQRFRWNIKSIGIWNKETFPDETTAGQRMKAKKEAAEYLAAQSYERRIQELADFYIANAGLASRFGDEGGNLVCLLIRDLPYWGEVNKEVQSKMEINQKREWERVYGEYRHIEEGCHQHRGADAVEGVVAKSFNPRKHPKERTDCSDL